jgi:hypothetical protein
MVIDDPAKEKDQLFAFVGRECSEQWLKTATSRDEGDERGR